MNEQLTGRLADLGYALGWHVVRAAPEGLTSAVFRAGADRAATRNGPGVQRLRANLARVLAHDGTIPDPAVLDAVVAEGMRSYARYWCETFRLPAMDPVALHDAVDPAVQGVEHLERALDQGRGVLAALTHSGNWDVAGAWLVRALAKRGRPATFVTVAERLRPDSLYRRFVGYRESLGFEVLPADAGARTIATLAARLRSNGVVCLVADRDLTGGGVEVDFFGERARLPGGPAQLARHTGAALLPFGGWFTPGGWGLRFHPPIEMPSGRGSDVVRGATQALADVFASDIAAHPADWHMLQPIWTADQAQPKPSAVEAT
ncbi:phosphatidylinositol mannoside acyltransferase [Pseudonocardia spinosispora]|uniref:phosphatidylinositol mannoside acyltransferase n=1 Tax=Pseudonocardia spinosispora TaxID=103441 RepID=UPI0004251F90|nr:phosphatidylinositol mannoside acyltransferase [Pseudonocardia spinosispora]